MKNKSLVIGLISFHVFIIALSNYLVQFPLSFYGIVFTIGMFTYPLVCLATDLTVRLSGKYYARVIVGIAYVPAILISIYLSNYRIGIASGCSYLIGQLLDISVFQKIRERYKSWWCAPLASTIVTNILDTYAFFAIAFVGSNTFLSNNWIRIASADLIFKMIVSLLIILPCYRIVLNSIPIIKNQLNNNEDIHN
jgi:uncharacterized PurR-regulated membrane protein YhhQ (DUF165 family)